MLFDEEKNLPEVMLALSLDQSINPEQPALILINLNFLRRSGAHNAIQNITI